MTIQKKMILYAFGLDRGIIGSDVSVDDGVEIIMRNLRDIVLKKYKISLDRRGKYYCNFYDREGVRRQKSSTSEEGLIQLLMEYELGGDVKKQKDIPTLESIYPKWIAMRKASVDGQTVIYDEFLWNKYYAGEKITQIDVRKIYPPDIKQWYAEKIREYGLTKKRAMTLKGVINGLFDYAVDSRIITSNPARQVHGISRSVYGSDSRPEEKEFFTDEEVEKITGLCFAKYRETGLVAYLAIVLNFSLGLRVGELVSLKISDFKEDVLVVQRQEVANTSMDDQGKNHRDGYRTVDYLKKGRDHREIPLSAGAKSLVKIIAATVSKGDDLFVKDGVRIHKDAVNRRMREICKELGIIQRSCHCIRKTYASILNESQLFTIEDIQKMLGHEDASTTHKYYLWSRKSGRDKSLLVDEALKGIIPQSGYITLASE